MTWLADLPTARGYQHPTTLETAVKLRDSTCRAPGCTRPATRCDCDHVTPYPQGETSLGNSCSLCRRHHRLKTHAPDWQMTITPDGDVTWTTPTGTPTPPPPPHPPPPQLPPAARPPRPHPPPV
jgi:hypothetical protein